MLYVILHSKLAGIFAVKCLLFCYVSHFKRTYFKGNGYSFKGDNFVKIVFVHI